MIQNKREKIFSQTADDLNVSDIESVIKTYLLNNRKKSTTNDNPTVIKLHTSSISLDLIFNCTSFHFADHSI